jgi:hypothetical protein
VTTPLATDSVEPQAFVPAPEWTDEQIEEFQEYWDAVAAGGHRVCWLPRQHPLTEDEMRQLLRECATVVKPGETLIVRVPTTWTPQQAVQYQEYVSAVTSQHAPELTVLVLIGDELGIAEATEQ